MSVLQSHPSSRSPSGSLLMSVSPVVLSASRSLPFGSVHVSRTNDVRSEKPTSREPKGWEWERRETITIIVQFFPAVTNDFLFHIPAPWSGVSFGARLRSRLRHSTPGPFVFRLRSPSRSAASRLLPAARNERRRGSVGKETAWVTVKGEETWHRLTLDLWLAKDNRFLNPKSSYKRILMAPSCRFIPLLVSVRHSSSPIVVSSLRPNREAAPPAGKEWRE